MAKKDIKAEKIESAYLESAQNILYTGYWLVDKINATLKPFKFTEPQYNVMRILAVYNESMSVKDIQERVLHKSSNISRIIDKLVKKGYVDRRISSVNRRKMDISLTCSGYEILRELDREIQKMYTSMVKNVNKEEVKRLSSLLDKFRG